MNMNDFIEMLQKKKVPYSIDGDKIFVNGNLNLHDASITNLPDNLSVRGWLDLRGTSITSLPDNLSVDGSLYLRGASITSLPNGLSVGGDLGLSRTGITRLPENLSVGDSIDLRYTGISSLPDNIEVYRSIYLHANRITNIVYRELWKHDHYTVFAAWLNGKCCVVVNEKIYTLGKFFGGAPAADVEQAARECVAELEQRRQTGGAA